MVYGWESYLKEKETKVHVRKKMALIIFAIFIFLLNVTLIFLYHPWIIVIQNSSSSNIIFTFQNKGNMPDKGVEITLTLNTYSPQEICTFSLPQNCFREDVGKRAFTKCRILEPQETVKITCERKNGELYSLVMKSVYQGIKETYACNAETCQKKESLSEGSVPNVWNYLVLYPIERVLEYIQKLYKS